MCPDCDALCKWGKQCENAHNDQELKEWEKIRQLEQSKKCRIRPLRKESKAEKCDKFYANGCSEGCEFAHGEVEERAWRAALGKWYVISGAYEPPVGQKRMLMDFDRHMHAVIPAPSRPMGGS